MRQSPIRDFIVGLFVLAGIASIAYLSIRVGGFSWRKTGGLNLSAEFDQTGGLSVRAPVLISGVRVGEVTSISLGKDFRAHVEMDLDKTLKLPSDTSASIVTSGLLGDRYIDLQPGAEEDFIPPGGKIAFTESAVILERLIGKLIYGQMKNGGQTASQPAETKP